MKKYEYEVVRVELSDREWRVLNLYGNVGWELVTVRPVEDGVTLLYLKREIIE